MKKLFWAAILAGLTVSSPSWAGPSSAVYPIDNAAHPTLMLGITLEFGDTINKPDIGITAKLLSSNKPDQFVFGGGVAYFPWAKQQLGLDLDVGYNFNNVGVLAGYDFLRWQPQISAGYVATDDGKRCPSDLHLSDGTCQAILSDRRLKRNIKLLAKLSNGMKIYAFKYLWSDTTYVGVMAQDLLADPRWAHAVVISDNGFYAVNYQSLGLQMTTLERWQAEGMSSVQLASADEYRRLKRAA